MPIAATNPSARPKYVDTIGAKRMLGVSRWTLMRWWRRGLISRYVTVTGRNRWVYDELQDMMRRAEQ